MDRFFHSQLDRAGSVVDQPQNISGEARAADRTAVGIVVEAEAPLFILLRLLGYCGVAELDNLLNGGRLGLLHYQHHERSLVSTGQLPGKVVRRVCSPAASCL